VPNYSAVEYRGIYSGVDAVFHGDNQRLEFDFDIAPGADPRTISLEVYGAARMRLNQAGNVALGTDGTRNVVIRKPGLYEACDKSSMPQDASIKSHKNALL
jgi:hypothetical protein